jgi:hypothetical protein
MDENMTNLGSIKTSTDGGRWKVILNLIVHKNHWKVITDD